MAEVVTTKHINTELKAAPESSGDAEGVFTGYASIFGNVDSYGEVVVKGAFAESLREQPSVPVYWSHQMSNPMMNIGKTIELREDDRGLFVKAQLDLDSEMGAQVHRLIKDGRVGQMSFAFDVEDYAMADSDELGPHVELRKLKVHEVSVVQVGANQATELLDVKDRVTRVKDSHAISEANEGKLEKAARLIGEVLGDDHGDPAPEGDEGDKDNDDEIAGDTSGEKSFDPDAALAAFHITITEGA